MRRPTLLFRIAAVLLLLFAAGHTFGFLTLVAPTPEARAARAAMDAAAFTIHGSTFTYGGFYVGFGLYITAFMLFAATLAWKLGDMARQGSRDAAFLGAALTLTMLFSLALSVRYFSGAPAVLSGLVALAVGGATLMILSAPSSSVRTSSR
jgi:hypothetical protein